MSEVDKEKLLRSFEICVTWLRNNIPPDDIYEFAQQMLLACVVFIRDFEDSEDFNKKMHENVALRIWYTNVAKLLESQIKGVSININLDFPGV